MRTWAWMTGGLLVWAVHFIGVYGIASIADVVSVADAPLWRGIALGFSAVCALAAAALLAASVRRLRAQGQAVRFPDQLAALGATLAGVAILWQSLPAVVG